MSKKEALGIIHTYTHFKVTVHAFRCGCAPIPKNKNHKWVRVNGFDDYPMGKVGRQIAHKL